MSNFYNALYEQHSTEYGKRIQIHSDLNKWRFELTYRQTSNGFHRTVTCFNKQGNISKTKTTEQSMVGEFNKENIENQFNHFISEEWTNYTPAR